MRLAFLAESTRQRTGGVGAVPILDLFSEEMHLLAREYLEHFPDDLRVVIISTKYGLCDSYKKVYPYSTGLTYERVDAWLHPFTKQFTQNEARWFNDVDDLFIGASGPYHYVLQRLGIAIDYVPRMQRAVYGNVASGPQCARWLNSSPARHLIT